MLYSRSRIEEDNGRSRRKAVSNTRLRWTNKIVPYTIQSGFSECHIDMIGDVWCYFDLAYHLLFINSSMWNIDMFYFNKKSILGTDMKKAYEKWRGMVLKQLWLSLRWPKKRTEPHLPWDNQTGIVQYHMEQLKYMGQVTKVLLPGFAISW